MRLLLGLFLLGRLFLLQFEVMFVLELGIVASEFFERVEQPLKDYLLKVLVCQVQHKRLQIVLLLLI